MAERLGKLPTTKIRFAYVAPDGSIPYFEASDGRQVGGRLPAGADPLQLKEAGYEFVDRETFTKTQAATDPSSRAEQEEVDELAEAFDLSIGTKGSGDAVTQLLEARTQRGAQQMNAPNGSAFSPELMEVLEQMMQEGTLPDLFQPFQQEQNVLDQQMAIASQTRQPGRERSTPMGAIFGGLSNAVGNIAGAGMQQKALEGQTALGKRMQGNASARLQALLDAIRGRNQVRRPGTVADVDPDMAPGMQLMETLGDEFLR